MLGTSDIFHIGMVVKDLESSMSNMAERMEVRWTDIVERRLSFQTPEGSQAVDMRIVYSMDGPNRVELIQEVPGTVWTVPEGVDAVMHHIGMWCGDVPGISHGLVQSGSPRILTFGDDATRATGMAYHRLPEGILIELVDSARRGGFEEWFAGGPYPAYQAAPGR